VKKSLIALAVLMAVAQPAIAQNKPIRLIVPFGAGSGSDIAGRFFGDQLSTALGQPVIVDNRPGANGNIGVMAAKNAAADGFTLLNASWTTLSVNPIVVKDLPYDPVKDFRPVSGLMRSQIALVVPGNSSFQNIEDLVAAAKKGGRALNIGTQSAGFHIILEWFNSVAGIMPVHIPYKNSGQLNIDVLGNQVDGAMDGTASLGPMIRSGKVRLLAVSGERRDAAFPDVRTFREAGYAEFVAYAWGSFSVRAETPDDLVQRLAEGMQKVMASGAAREFTGKIGSELMPLGPAAMRKFHLEEIERFRRIAQAAGIKPE
jgi:tripartite-type tricarboxylate transporter receptor subunit TctC